MPSIDASRSDERRAASDEKTLSSLVAHRSSLSPWPWIFALALAIAAARLIYLRWLCPYDLTEDEAFYWDWARHLDWSYYTKGPGIAWAIWLSVRVFGDTDLAIRAIAVVSGLVSTLAVAGLTLDVTGRHRRAAMLAAAFFNLVPVFQGTSILGTIDAPYISCWALASWAAWRAFMRRSVAAWLGLGAALAAGFLFKYTILLLLPGVLVFAVMQRAHLALPRRWPWLALAATLLLALGTLPVVIWNAQHHWVTIAHLLGHVGVNVDPAKQVATIAPLGPPAPWAFNPMWMPEYLGIQLALAGPLLVAAVIAGAVALHRRWSMRYSLTAFTTLPGWDAQLFLWLLAAPLFLFYFVVSFLARPEGNWPAATYVTLVPLVAWWLGGAWPIGITPAALRGWRIVIVSVGLVTGLGMLRLDLVKRALGPSWLAAAKAIPTGRIMGGRAMAAHADRLRAQLKARTGLEPIIIGQNYGKLALMAFYLPDHPHVFCTASRTGGHTMQHDFWPDADLDRPSLIGKPAVAFGGTHAGWPWTILFEHADELGVPLEGEHRDDPTFLCTGYRGFPATAGAPISNEPPREGPR